MLILTNPKHSKSSYFIIHVTENILVSSRGLTRPSVWSHLLTTGCRFTLLRSKNPPQQPQILQASALRSPDFYWWAGSGSGSERHWIFARLREAAGDFKTLKVMRSSNRPWAPRCLQISTFYRARFEWRHVLRTNRVTFCAFKIQGKDKSESNKQANKQNKPQSAADTLQSSAVRLFNGLSVLKATPKEAWLPVKQRR